jgi:hypothetical protein
MADTRWTPSLIEERFVEAADVMKRLPEVRVPGYFNTWPKVLREFSDLVGQEPPRLRRPPPAPDAISRMEETLNWLHWLEPTDARIVWLRATGERWKTVCWKVGLQRAAAHEHWLYALCVIVWRLNGKTARPATSKRRLIEQFRQARIRSWSDPVPATE